MQKYTIEEHKYFIEAFYKSGMTQHAFSEQHNITKSTHSYWLRKKCHDLPFVNVSNKLPQTTKSTFSTISNMKLLKEDSQVQM